MTVLNETNVAIYEAWKRARRLPRLRRPSYTALAKQFAVTRNQVAGAVWRGRKREQAVT